MPPSRRPGHVRHWRNRARALLTSLALLTVGAQAQAQEQTARSVKDANRSPENLPPGIEHIESIQPIASSSVVPMDALASGKQLSISPIAPKQAPPASAKATAPQAHPPKASKSPATNFPAAPTTAPQEENFTRSICSD